VPLSGNESPRRCAARKLAKQNLRRRIGKAAALMGWRFLFCREFVFSTSVAITNSAANVARRVKLDAARTNERYLSFMAVVYAVFLIEMSAANARRRGAFRDPRLAEPTLLAQAVESRSLPWRNW
jgi:hypothetical protein